MDSRDKMLNYATLPNSRVDRSVADIAARHTFLAIFMGVGRIFPKSGAKVVKFVFSNSKQRKRPFFAKIFKFQGRLGSPSDAHDYISNMNIRSKPCIIFLAKQIAIRFGCVTLVVAWRWIFQTYRKLNETKLCGIKTSKELSTGG